MAAFTKGDNKLVSLSRAYAIDVDTGWDVPPGVMHAPASMCTYEPQFASDVYAMYQSVLYFDHVVGEDLLWKNCPKEHIGDFDYLVEVMDWEMNLDPMFYQNRRMTPQPVADMAEMQKEGYIDEWICYKCDLLGARRYTVLPGCTATLKDDVAYGLICVQGFGTINGMELSSPNMICFGQLTHDEYFVTESASKEGVTFTNLSKSEPLVILRHFARRPE